MATGGAQSTLGETELKVIATGVGAGSNKTEVSEATASVGPYSTPAPLEHSYLTVRESVVYEEVP